MEKDLGQACKIAIARFVTGLLDSLLDLCKGNVCKAAKLVGKYRADVYTLLKKHDLDKSTFKKSE